MFNMRRKWITSADAECGIAGKYETPQDHLNLLPGLQDDGGVLVEVDGVVKN